MKINTTRFGEIEVSEQSIFHFISPIIGYENLKNFAFIDNSPESPFKWLQSCEDAAIAFPVTIPSFFGLDYQFMLPDAEAKKLEITDGNQVLTLNIVNIPSSNPKGATINLLAPLVINAENLTAMQIILPDDNLSVRHPLFIKKPEFNKQQIIEETVNSK